MNVERWPAEDILSGRTNDGDLVFVRCKARTRNFVGQVAQNIIPER
jgi:hypothetical protein